MIFSIDNTILRSLNRNEVFIFQVFSMRVVRGVDFHAVIDKFINGIHTRSFSLLIVFSHHFIEHRRVINWLEFLAHSQKVEVMSHENLLNPSLWNELLLLLDLLL